MTSYGLSRTHSWETEAQREVLVGNVALFHSLILFKSFYGLVIHGKSLLRLHFTPGCDEGTPAIPALGTEAGEW